MTIMILFVAGIQEAEATKKVYSPHVEKGEWEIETRGSYDFDDRSSKSDKVKEKFAIGYGVTDYWLTEFYGQIERGASEEDFDFTEWEWENRFELTEPGEFWVDVGLYVAYELKNGQDKSDKMEGKILLEKSFGKFKHRANINFEQEVGGDRTSNDLEGGFAWLTRYKLTKLVQPGVEYYIDFGSFQEGNSYDEQTHQLGPVLHGKMGHVEYDVGYLFGLTDPAPEGSLKWILEYEWEF